MDLGLTRIGALGRAAAPKAMAAVDRMHGQALRAVAPPADPAPVRDQIRDRVLAERGMDRIALARLGPLARLEAEISVDVETARRLQKADLRKPTRAVGSLVDIRV